MMIEKANGSPRRSDAIAELNDKLRQSGCGGQCYVTRGVAARGPGFVLAARRAVRAFSDFTADNDPHGERDFGAFELMGERLFWKIDYYDPTLTWASEDPSNPERTVRVLTIMLAEEY
jgi:hypothetical protein